MDLSLVLNIPFVVKDQSTLVTWLFHNLKFLTVVPNPRDNHLTPHDHHLSPRNHHLTWVDFSMCMCDWMNSSLLIEGGQIYWPPPSHQKIPFLTITHFIIICIGKKWGLIYLSLLVMSTYWICLHARAELHNTMILKVLVSFSCFCTCPLILMILWMIKLLCVHASSRCPIRCWWRAWTTS